MNLLRLIQYHIILISSLLSNEEKIVKIAKQFEWKVIEHPVNDAEWSCEFVSPDALEWMITILYLF